MRRVIAVLVVGLIVGVAQAGFAQDAIDQDQPKAKPVAAQGSKPVPAKDDREAPRTLLTPAKMINVQVEITITDTIGNGPPTTKTVSLITSDNTMGRIRSRAETRFSGQPIAINLNIDALPRVVGDQVLMNLTIEYNPLKTSDGSADSRTVSPTQLNQSLSIVMSSGKSMIVSQAADPVTDRKIVAEAKATILK